MHKSLLLLFLLFLPQISWAAGHEQGNGGDLYSAEFVDLGHRTAELLRNNNFHGFDLAQLSNALVQVQVESTDLPLTLEGVPKDAINFPAAKKILFNRQRWNTLNAGEKPVLVLHEYLSILGIEGEEYRFSRSVLGEFQYDTSYQINCILKDRTGNLNIGIDESAAMDTILLTLNWADGRGLLGNTMRPVGEFSRMIRDGEFQMAFEGEDEGKNSYLVALRAGLQPLTMTGQFAGISKVLAMECTIQKFDLSR